MFAQLKKFFDSPEPVEDRPDELRLAVAVLLVEAAHMDDQFGPHEREVIAKLLKEKFELSEDETHELVELSAATVARAAQLHPYTRTCFTEMDEEERLHIVEMLWEVAFVDGVLDPEEDLLIRKVSGLIAVEDRDRIHARQRVLARMKGGN